jgi:Na+/proline symporter
VADGLSFIMLVGVLALFCWLGLRVGRDRDVEQFTVARNSQSGAALGLSFLASGFGAWMLIAPPEVGATVGVLGVAGYAVAVAVPLVALALLGARLRTLMPEGHSLTEFARVRFGGGMRFTVLAFSLLYMLVAVTAELTAAGAVVARLSGLDPRVVILAVVASTLVYTAYGGLRASLRTDGWQAWLLLVLLAIAATAILVRLPTAGSALGTNPLMSVDMAGAEGAVTLVLAVVVTTLFHNGYWQRVWAARDQRALRRGVAIGIATRVPIVFAVGMTGVLAAGVGADLGTPPVPFFVLLEGLSAWVIAVVLVLALALVASSVDTLENGMAALIATERPGIGLRGARMATVVVMLPATLAAFQGYSVLRLLLIADLLCAALVVPALLGLWRRTTTAAAVCGCVAGFVAAFAHGWAVAGSVAGTVRVATFADGLAIGPFVAVLGASGAVTALIALAQGRTVDVAALGAAVRSFTPQHPTPDAPDSA